MRIKHKANESPYLDTVAASRVTKAVKLHIHFITSSSNCLCENQFLNIIGELTTSCHMLSRLLQQIVNIF